MKKRIVIISLIVIGLFSPNFVFAKNVAIEGTIQGLLTTLSGNICPIGEEKNCASIERTFVLLADDGSFYMVPTFTPSQVAPYINKRVKVEGKLVLNGKGIDVNTAELFQGGRWVTVFSPEIVEAYERNVNLANNAKKALRSLN